jgi:hypothetical protein
MDQIQPYDPAEDKTKACWFPFKKAYDRRTGHENTAKIYVLDGNDGRLSKSVELSLTDYAGIGSEEQSEAPAPTSRMRPLPSDLLTLPLGMDDATVHNSILGEEDDLFFGYGETSRLAAINPNCISKEFWVDEMVEGGSLACAENFVHAGRSVNRIGRSFNSLGSSSTKVGSSTKNSLSGDISFSRDPTPTTKARIGVPTTKARIEVEYDFSKNLSYSSAHEKDTVQRGGCGAISLRRKCPEDASVRSRTEISYISNSTMTGVTTRRGPPPSHTSASTSHSSSSGESSVMIPPSELVHPAPIDPVSNLEPLSHRFFCGAMQPMPPVAKKEPSKPEVIEEEKETEDPTPLAPVKAGEPSESSSLSERKSFQGIECTKNPSLDSMWASTNKRGCSVPDFRAGKARPLDLDDPLDPHFFIEVEATEQRLREVRDLNEMQESKVLLPPMDVDFARTASLVDDDSAFQGGEGIVGVFRRTFAPKRRPTPGKRRPTTTRRLQNVPESPPVVTPLIGKTRVTVTALSKTQYRPAPVTPDRISLSCVRDSSYIIDSLEEPKRMKRLSSRSPGREPLASSQMNDGPDPGLEYSSAQHSSMPEGALPIVRGSSQDLGTQSYKRTASRKSSSRRPIVMEKDTPDIPSRVLLSAGKHRSNDSRGKDSNSSSSASEFRSDTQRSLYQVPDRSPQMELVEEIDYGDMTTETGQASNEDEDVANDFEVAKFPSLTEEDWQKTTMEHMNVTRLSSRIVSKDRSTSWNRRIADHNFNANFGSESEMMGVGGAAHEESRPSHTLKASSLEESFENAIPFVGKHSGVKGKHNDRIDGGVTTSRSRSWKSGRMSSWIDDDDVSDLNTEAFQRLAMDTDDDSIFNGLVERAPRARGVRSRERDGPPTQVDTLQFQAESLKAVEDDGDSVASKNSVEKSKYTSYSAADQSKYSQYTRGDLSKYSSRSMVSRGGVVYKEALEDPFTCMDNWVDT